MKKLTLLTAVTISVFVLVSASVWEGAAAIGENFPENGYFIATNSFPVNTIVEIINLENDRKATVIVSSSFNNSGLLALLSKNAADYIGLGKLGRIRMVEKDDQLSYSGPGERRFFSGDPNYNADVNSGNERAEGGEKFVDLDGYDLTLVPAETRPPQVWSEPEPEFFIPSIPEISEKPVVIPEQPAIAERYIIPAVPAPSMSAPVVPPVPRNSSPARTQPVFSAPFIYNFDRGMYYVQIGAYKTAQTVESEILKIEKNLPVAIMKIGADEEPIYRVLIGPLNLGESGAVLQRYKTIYKDAFLRVGN